MTESQKQAQRRYDAKSKNKWRMFHFKLNKDTDKDIIDKMESQTSIQGYIKELVRKDIE